MAIVQRNSVGEQIPSGRPHGGRLINRVVEGDEQAQELRARARELPSLRLSARQVSDLRLIGNGAFSPLEGFMERAAYERVVAQMQLAAGVPWTVPVTLAVSDEDAPREGGEIALYDYERCIAGRAGGARGLSLR